MVFTIWKKVLCLETCFNHFATKIKFFFFTEMSCCIWLFWVAAELLSNMRKCTSMYFWHSKCCISNLTFPMSHHHCLPNVTTLLAYCIYMIRNKYFLWNRIRNDIAFIWACIYTYVYIVYTQAYYQFMYIDILASNHLSFQKV